MDTLFKKHNDLETLSVKEYGKLLWDLDMAKKHLAFCGKYAEAFNVAMTVHYGSVFCRLKLEHIKPSLPEFLSNELVEIYENLFTLFAENESKKKIKEYVDSYKASDVTDAVLFFTNLIKYSEPFGDFLYFPVLVSKKIVDVLGCRVCITNELATIFKQSKEKINSMFLVCEDPEDSKLKAVLDSLIVLNYNAESFVAVDTQDDKPNKTYFGFDFIFGVCGKNTEEQKNKISSLLESIKGSTKTLDALLFIHGLEEKSSRVEISWYIPLKSLNKHLKSAPSIAGLQRFLSDFGIDLANGKAALELSRLFVDLRFFARNKGKIDASNKPNFIKLLRKHKDFKGLHQYNLDADTAKYLKASIAELISLLDKDDISDLEYRNISRLADHWHNLYLSIQSQFEFALSNSTIESVLTFEE